MKDALESLDLDAALIDETGEVVPGMTLCVEPGGPDGVKLEEQVLVTESGYRMLSGYPFVEDFLRAA